MPSVLTIEHREVPPTARAGYVAALRDRERYFRDAQCRFWVFEAVTQPGAFVEFVEAKEPEALAAAWAGVRPAPVAPPRVYTAVEEG